MKIIFQQNVFFQHTYARVNGNNLDVFCEITYVKLSNYNWNGTIIHIQYMIVYFIKFCSYLNHCLGIFAFCNIL
jgi:hypothetical protein